MPLISDLDLIARYPAGYLCDSSGVIGIEEVVVTTEGRKNVPLLFSLRQRENGWSNPAVPGGLRKTPFKSLPIHNLSLAEPLEHTSLFTAAGPVFPGLNETDEHGVLRLKNGAAEEVLLPAIFALELTGLLGLGEKLSHLLRYGAPDVWKVVLPPTERDSKDAANIHMLEEWFALSPTARRWIKFVGIEAARQKKFYISAIPLVIESAVAHGCYLGNSFFICALDFPGRRRLEGQTLLVGTYTSKLTPVPSLDRESDFQLQAENKVIEESFSKSGSRDPVSSASELSSAGDKNASHANPGAAAITTPAAVTSNVPEKVEAAKQAGRTVDMVRDLGRVIRSRRGLLGYTIHDLAALCGVSTTYLFELENGKPRIQFGLALDVAAAIGLELQYVRRLDASTDWRRVIVPLQPAQRVPIHDAARHAGEFLVDGAKFNTRECLHGQRLRAWRPLEQYPAGAMQLSDVFNFVRAYSTFAGEDVRRLLEWIGLCCLLGDARHSAADLYLYKSESEECRLGELPPPAVWPAQTHPSFKIGSTRIADAPTVYDWMSLSRQADVTTKRLATVLEDAMERVDRKLKEGHVEGFFFGLLPPERIREMCEGIAGRVSTMRQILTRLRTDRRKP